MPDRIVRSRPASFAYTTDSSNQTSHPQIHPQSNSATDQEWINVPSHSLQSQDKAAYQLSQPSSSTSSINFSVYNQHYHNDIQDRPSAPLRSTSTPANPRVDQTSTRPPYQTGYSNLNIYTDTDTQPTKEPGNISPAASAISDPGPSHSARQSTDLDHLRSQESSTPRTRSPSDRSAADASSKRDPNEISARSRGKSTASQAITAGTLCAKCNDLITGQFVRALGSVYHLDCFRCTDCNKVVAHKFFPVDAPDGSQFPLCETDYFRRLNLLCASCGGALRGSYITALDKKFHVEHFTCSICPTVFGPQDSYYEHENGVYCHFHYSTLFAVKCTGCQSAILKQFVEINRYDKDEHWHPECYMIHKFWNTKVVSSRDPKRKASRENQAAQSSSSDAQGTLRSNSGDGSPALSALPEDETPESLKEKQAMMEEKVYRIWTVLSTFEESSAACISEMLKFVSSLLYLDGIKMAEKFVLHVETLFAGIDDLNSYTRSSGSKEIGHVREARMLCKKIVNFFSLLSHTNDVEARKTGISQELLSLVTGLAHYLKILIRIALTAALKLEREAASINALNHLLSRFDRLARDPEASQHVVTSQNPTAGKKSKPYGYRSLLRLNGTMVGQGEATTDLCEGCRTTIEEECTRFATSLRWHLYCLHCATCGRIGGPLPSKEKDAEGAPIPVESPPVLPLSGFRLEPKTTEGSSKVKAGNVYCSACTAQHGITGLRDGFEHVTKLEQYAFLLCVALNKLYSLLKAKGVLTAQSDRQSMISDSDNRSVYDTYRDSTEIKRMKSVTLDRKLSTTARIPQRSTVVEGPSGRVGQVGADPHAFPGRDQPVARQLPVTVPGTPPVSSWPAQRADKPVRPPPFNPDKSSVARPQVQRALTAIKVVDEDPQDAPVALSYPTAFRSPADNEDGITLADLPQVMAAEQARVDHSPSPKRQHEPCLSELSAIEHVVVRHAAALLLTAENSPFQDVISLDEALDLIEARKNNFWVKMFKGTNEKKGDKKKGVFGITIEALVDRGGVKSVLGAGPSPVTIPAFLDDVISAMKQMDMSIEGVFRKNGNIRRLKELSDSLDRDPYAVNLMDENPVQLAALLKKFLRELPDPLLTSKMHYLFMATQKITDEQQRLRVLHLVTCLMPRSHREATEVLFIFLKWVASFSHVDEETGSRMDLQNLATVICPNILYAKGKDPTKDESFASIQTIVDILEHQEELWKVPIEIRSVLQNAEFPPNSEITSKDIIRHCRQFAGRPQHPHLHHPVPLFGSPERGAVPLPSPAARERPMSWQASANGVQNGQQQYSLEQTLSRVGR